MSRTPGGRFPEYAKNMGQCLVNHMQQWREIHEMSKRRKGMQKLVDMYEFEIELEDDKLAALNDKRTVLEKNISVPRAELHRLLRQIKQKSLSREAAIPKVTSCNHGIKLIQVELDGVERDIRTSQKRQLYYKHSISQRERAADELDRDIRLKPCVDPNLRDGLALMGKDLARTVENTEKRMEQDSIFREEMTEHTNTLDSQLDAIEIETSVNNNDISSTKEAEDMIDAVILESGLEGMPYPPNVHACVNTRSHQVKEGGNLEGSINM